MIQRFTAKFLSTFLAFLFLAALVYAQPNGEQLFKANCVQCHSTTDAKVVGPGLKDILKRRTIEWIIPWVHDNKKVIASGDAYAVKVFEANNKTPMTTFPGLKDDEIKAIIAYVKEEGDKAPAPAAATLEGF